ncbi:MAG: electron transport complex subunit E [Clostridia bacterium]|nr:electron transport complex subunit E [Clostridia bacterium]
MKLKKGSPLERIYNGVWRENPTFVLMLGMCATLAVTTSAVNAIAMGLSTAAVLIFSNLIISALRKLIPDGVRMPAYIVIVATLVTVVEFLMHAFLTDLYDALGIYLPLIVVNCIILGRAEAYASKNPVLSSVFDGLGMGLGFTASLTIIGLVREFIGSGTLFGFTVLGDWFTPVSIFVMAPGAFFVLAIIAAVRNVIVRPHVRENAINEISCGGNCRYCSGTLCAENHRRLREDETSASAPKAAEKEAKS